MNCDPLARWYRWLEYLGMGRALMRRRREYLTHLASARRVLILGEGDGRFLRDFVSVNRSARVDCVDSSSRMIQAARERLAAPGDGDAASRVKFHHADARSWNPVEGTRYDLIITHFFLDCFTEDELRALVPKLAASTDRGARWVVSEFHQPARGWEAWRSRIWIRGLYLLFGWTTGLKVRRLPRYRPLLEAAGFALAGERIASSGMLVSERWERKTGVAQA